MTYPEFPASLQQLEEGLLEQWRAEDLFRATMDATSDGEPFVFYEGPPTANGRPGLHHIISRAIKDLVCRYQTMQGRSVTRIAGWDTHGLPVEIEAERKLGISGKPEIEALGIEAFNRACRDSVFTYKEEWERLSERIAYWLDYSRPYVTFHAEYVESVWAVLKRFADDGLLYRGHKSVPYCPRCGTALSSHEVAQGYEDVEDPSLTFLAPVLGVDGERDGRYFAVWTTTPWTVPSNIGLAVHPDLVYAEVQVDDRRLIVAKDRVEAVLGEDARIVAEHAGRDLEGLRYGRPIDFVPEPSELGAAWTVVLEGFVSADDGTGIVHMAPAFGADDYAAGLRHGLPMLRPVDDAGHFTEGLPEVGGLFVKDADPVVIEALERRGLLFEATSEVHSYPHCWRCRSPLIYMARDSWFAATSTRKDEMLANNDQVSWHPPEVGEKRFGEWLKGNVDWALSRDRYWGTPLPAWVCDADEDHVEWLGSFAELAERVGDLGDDFDPHRPFIDELTWSCDCGGTMRRTPGVVDVWFDSGSMPYAQWHYPFENEQEFEAHFPADFICEGLDQTRGWFYSLMAISTLLGRGTPFRNVVVNDLILDAEGRKMSKSRGNTVDPWDAVAEHGADAVRWYLMTVSNPWVPKRYDPEGVAEASRKFFDTLANTYRFFALYASIEGWSPSEADPAPADRPILDRWLLSRLDALTETVRAELDAYQLTRAYRAVIDFVDDLSNWYVRRSRSRFWGNTDAADARAAFATLRTALVEVAGLVAPVTPFVADWLYRALSDGASVHLSSFPAADAARRDRALEDEMAAARVLVSLGRAAREEVKIRVRQPLRRIQAVVPGAIDLREEVLDTVRDELNVKEVAFLGSADGLVRLEARPNYRALGPRFGKSTNDAANAIRALPSDALAAFRAGESVEFELAGSRYGLEPDDVEVVEIAEGDLVVKSEHAHTVALDPALDDELRAEGLARELVNRIQRLRKDTGLEVTDRIRLGIFGGDEVRGPAEQWRDFIGGETLAVDVTVAEALDGGWEGDQAVDLDGVPAHLALARAEAPGA
ncbi:isoleucine--tRNA ligase [Gaopeijia maritima]|uniref:isoleucine--tRNA ligase n=1 Tax=Gaopeijia maritima TaxID=3119007 RepID=UPI00328DE42C